jgi:porin
MQSSYTSTPYLSPGFHQTQWYCSFFTTSCGNTAAYASNSNKAPYWAGSWGGNITFHPAPHWYVKAGVFENQPIEATSSDHLGWPTADWGINEANGAFLPLQLGYITTPASSPYPTNAQIGGYYDTASFLDKYYNAKGQVAAFHPGPPLIHHGGTAGLFAGIQQTVYRFNQNPKSARGVALFFTGDWDLHSNQSIQQQYAAGTIITGPFASRAADTINLLTMVEVFEGRLIAGRDAIAAAHGVKYHMARTEIGGELNYGFAASPGITVYPFGQYIVHPNELGLTVPTPKDRFAWTVGVRAVVRFETLLGLPVLN